MSWRGGDSNSFLAASVHLTEIRGTRRQSGAPPVPSEAGHPPRDASVVVTTEARVQTLTHEGRNRENESSPAMRSGEDSRQGQCSR
jgi:hypothetical protein